MWTILRLKSSCRPSFIQGPILLWLFLPGTPSGPVWNRIWKRVDLCIHVAGALRCAVEAYSVVDRLCPSKS